MTFYEFAHDFCEQVQLSLPDVPQGEALDPAIEKRANTLIGNIRTQCKRFDKVPMQWIVNRLSDNNEVRKCLDAYNDGDIPDELFELLAVSLYDVPFSEMTVCYQNIIETLAVYVIVSHVRDSIK